MDGDSISIIAVAHGDGLRDIFMNLGADEVIDGGYNMNTGTEKLLAIIEKVDSSHVIVLPNSGAMLSAVSKALNETEKEIGLIASLNIPEGLAAIISFSKERSFKDNVSYMNNALQDIKTGEVTSDIGIAHRSDIQVSEGSFLGIVNEEVHVVGQSPAETAIDLMSTMIQQDDEVIVIFYGRDVSEQEAEYLAIEAEDKFPSREVEIYYGGQQNAYYIITVG